MRNAVAAAETPRSDQARLVPPDYAASPSTVFDHILAFVTGRSEERRVG